MNDGPMKKGSKKNHSDMQTEYDFSRGVRGKYARCYAEGTNVVVLEKLDHIRKGIPGR